MKHLSIKSAITAGVLSLTLVSGNAYAHCKGLKFYAGATADYNSYKVSKEFKDYTETLANSKIKFNGVGATIPVLGVKINRHMGVEAAYSMHKKLKVTSNNPDAVFKVSNMYMDVIGFMPVAKHVELIGGVGIGKLITVKSEGMGNITDIRNSFSYRAKAGVSYNCFKNIGIRGLITYQNVGNKLQSTTAALNDSKFIKNMVSFSVGLTYKF